MNAQVVLRQQLVFVVPFEGGGRIVNKSVGFEWVGEELGVKRNVRECIAVLHPANQLGPERMGRDKAMHQKASNAMLVVRDSLPVLVGSRPGARLAWRRGSPAGRRRPGAMDGGHRGHDEKKVVRIERVRASGANEKSTSDPTPGQPMPQQRSCYLLFRFG